MAEIIADRVLETSTTTGTGAFTLAGAITGFRAFSAVCAVSDTFSYMIEAIDSGGSPTGDWEAGTGTYSGANTLTRTTVTASSNAGAAVNFGAGTKRVALASTAAFQTTMYRTGGTDVSLADGGTGASLTDPNADRIVFWDDSAGAMTWLTPGTGLTITGTTIEAAGGAASADVQDFTASGTWTKPAGTPKLVQLIMWGGGGGGGGGNSSNGGQGGTGAGYTECFLSPGDLGATESVTIGSGGSAGSGGGGSGGTGGYTAFGSHRQAGAGAGGNNGSGERTSSAPGVLPAGYGGSGGTSGAAAGAGGNIRDTPSGTSQWSACPGGGGGSGFNNGNGFAGGCGVLNGVGSAATSGGGASGGAGMSGGAGTAGAARSGTRPGTGGGGGGAHSSGTGGAGGDGGSGAGGGGGGYGSSAGGAGGIGGGGFCRVVTYF